LEGFLDKSNIQTICKVNIAENACSNTRCSDFPAAYVDAEMPTVPEPVCVGEHVVTAYANEHVTDCVNEHVTDCVNEHVTDCTNEYEGLCDTATDKRDVPITKEGQYLRERINETPPVPSNGDTQRHDGVRDISSQPKPRRNRRDSRHNDTYRHTGARNAAYTPQKDATDIAHDIQDHIHPVV